MSQAAYPATGVRARLSLRPTEKTTLAVAYAGIACSYVATRLVLLPRFPPFIDETTFATWLQRGYTNPAERLLAVSRGREPLFIWLGMVGMKLGFDPLTSLRLVSFAAGIVTMTFTALIAARLGGRRAAVTAAALYLVLPFAFVHDVVGIMDPLVAAITAVALYLQLRLAEEQRLDLALLLGITLAAGVLTKQTADVAIVLIPASLLLFSWHDPERWRRLSLWVGAVLLAEAMARLSFFLMALNPDYHRLAEIRSELRQRHTLHEFLQDPWSIASTNGRGLLGGYSGYFTWPFVALLVAGIVLALRTHRRLSLVLLLWAVAPFLLAVPFAELPFPRYVLGSLPPLVAFLALGVVRAADALAARLPRWGTGRVLVVAGAALAVAAPALAFDASVERDPNRAKYPAWDDVQYAKGWPSGNGWVAFMHEVRRRTPGGARVAVGSFITFSNIVPLRLPPSGGYAFVDAASSEGRSAPFLVESQIPSTDRGFGELRRVWSYVRPRGGPPVVLYVRGFRVRGRFAATPEEVRTILGLSTDAFPRWLARHPQVRAWSDSQPVAANTS